MRKRPNDESYFDEESIAEVWFFFLIDILNNFPGTIKFGDVTSIRLSVLSMRSKDLKSPFALYWEFSTTTSGMGCYENGML